MKNSETLKYQIFYKKNHQSFLLFAVVMAIKPLKEEESIDILKILDLINNIESTKKKMVQENISQESRLKNNEEIILKYLKSVLKMDNNKHQKKYYKNDHLVELILDLFILALLKKDIKTNRQSFLKTGLQN